jgi:phosphopantothenoylcysteine synthetase/decarboxylase
MRAIVTCGPSHEPIDRVRRLTNFSTGELGLLLAAELVRAGHEVVCFKGEGATSRIDPAGAEQVLFSTNEELLRKIRELRGRVDAGAVFHAAALCDYRVGAVRAGDGTALAAAKIPTGWGNLTLSLEPAPKLLPLLRGLFPRARIVGWKYELEGTRDDALAKARIQITECGSDACVVNGAAWGAGFGFVEPREETVPVPDKPALCAFLIGWLAKGR